MSLHKTAAALEWVQEPMDFETQYKWTQEFYEKPYEK